MSGAPVAATADRAQSPRIRVPSIVLVMALVLLQSACQRTLVFTEQTAFKLGIEVNNDPTTPVEVTAGLKRRVLSVSPPKLPASEDEQGQAKAEGESVSMLSWFDLGYKPSTSPLTGVLTIRTQFASGGAATEIATNSDAIAAVVGVPVVAAAPEALQERREAAAAFVKSLTPEQADQLAAQLGLATGPQATVNVLQAISAANTESRFKVIAQSIAILFDKEV
jgi:hypothetical protein